VPTETLEFFNLPTQMNRTRYPGQVKNKVKDAINCSSIKDYTQVPNELLRNPKISLKAKALLSLLLSNKEGWVSYVSEIVENKTLEGREAINTGFKELEEHGYILKFRYRDIQSKKWIGSFWAYTDIPNQFYISESLKQLDLSRIEVGINADKLYKDPQPAFPDTAFHVVGAHHVENPELKILILKNIKYKNIKSSIEVEETSQQSNTKNSDPKDDKITLSKFERFWKMYPRKIDKGKCKTIWNRLCNRKHRPKWKDISVALAKQKKSERWQNKKYIPHPSTWLNQERWLDDPSEMISYSDNNEQNTPEQTPEQIIEQYFTGWQKSVINDMCEKAKEIIDDSDTRITQNICELSNYISSKQSKDAKNNKDIPGGMFLVKEYIYWLNEQDWISNKDASLLSPGKVFKIFTDKISKQVKVDIYTGKLKKS
jgi:hypothetical protein